MDKNIIKKVRHTALLTQTEFARELGVFLTTIQKWEQGQRNPSFKHQRKILEFCKKHEIDIEKIKKDLEQ